MNIRFNLALLVLLVAAAADLHAQGGSHYIPVAIPTRDGKTLAADLYANDTTIAKPTILVQTPYNKNFYRLAINIPPEAGGSPFPYDSAHYNYVVLDWRGFYGSTAAAVSNYDRGLDGYDAVEWIARQRWSDGRVGTWGPSALGAIQFMTAKYRPPHLVCSVPLVKDFKTKYTDFYYGGAFRQEHVQSLEQLGLASVSVILLRPTEDITWQVVERSSDYPDSIAVPMLLIGGWYDHYPDDVIRAFYDLRTRSAPAVRSAHKLLMGPWMHSNVGKRDQGDLSYPNAAGASDSAALRFFDYYLRNANNGYPGDAVIRYYQMGENQWHTTDDWYGLCASADTLRFQLAAGRTLVAGPNPPGVPVADTMHADPHNPSRTYGGARLAPFDPTAVDGPVNIADSVEKNGDILVYSTDVLTEDLTVTGGVTADLTVSVDRADADVAVRLSDVYPDGRSIILTQGIKRCRFRKGLRPQDTAAMHPGQAERVTVELQNEAMTFRAGHRLRVDISGTNAPLYAINPNSGGELYKPGDSLIATIVIHSGSAAPSSIVMPGVRRVGAVSRAGAGSGIRLDAVVPNPVTSSAAISFTLDHAAPVLLAVYDLLGNHVATLVDGVAEAGEHRAEWTPGGATAGGVYICRLLVDGHAMQQRMVVRGK